MVNRYLILWGSCLGREQKGNILQMYTVDCTDCMLVYHVMLRSHLLWGSSSFLQSQSHVHFLTASNNSNHAAGVRGPCQLRQILIKLSSWSQVLHCQDKSSSFLQHFPTQSPKPMASEAMPSHAGLRMPFRSLVLAHAALVGTEGRSLPGGIKPSHKGVRFCCWKRNPHDCCYQKICFSNWATGVKFLLVADFQPSSPTARAIKHGRLRARTWDITHCDQGWMAVYHGQTYHDWSSTLTWVKYSSLQERRKFPLLSVVIHSWLCILWEDAGNLCWLCNFCTSLAVAAVVASGHQ